MKLIIQLPEGMTAGETREVVLAAVREDRRLRALRRDARRQARRMEAAKAAEGKA